MAVRGAVGCQHHHDDKQGGRFERLFEAERQFYGVITIVWFPVAESHPCGHPTYDILRSRAQTFILRLPAEVSSSLHTDLLHSRIR